MLGRYEYGSCTPSSLGTIWQAGGRREKTNHLGPRTGVQAHSDNSATRPRRPQQAPGSALVPRRVAVAVLIASPRASNQCQRGVDVWLEVASGRATHPSASNPQTSPFFFGPLFSLCTRPHWRAPPSFKFPPSTSTSEVLHVHPPSILTPLIHRQALLQHGTEIFLSFCFSFTHPIRLHHRHLHPWIPLPHLKSETHPPPLPLQSTTPQPFLVLI
ncbi:hypothetical protein B0T11DRAFT_143714 [Plectosphaerella cucumerina]|uniref:Uncharacterized protein n=1 Tax=Plectosphaerella cucumerina TaxID=40658 RepID=A0A8K0WYI8_9PEZI|nr:hypothetical protein B0T11DRAFT_143714 [Plectosphaerella cucumerina]